MTTATAYTPGHTGNAVAFMRQRRAATHARFALDLFKPGMNVLDCGCGPGSITLDLARIVKPGAVAGIDAQGEQFAESLATAAQDGLNLRLETGSVTALQFPNGFFDAVFSHALFEHLPDPATAAREILRVLKPGGFVALRSPDWGGFMLNPFPSDVAVGIALYESIQRGNGGDTHAGRKLPAILRAAGFTRIAPTASYEVYDDPKRIAEYLALQLDRVGREDTAKAAAALRGWCVHPDAYFAQAWGEAVGWKG